MTKAELIAALADFPDESNIYVWESYDAGCMTTDIAVNFDGDIVLEAK